MFRIITTSDGSHTIFVPEINEHYHSIHGAIQESDYIFIRNGFDFCLTDPLNIFEVGFGTGLNALLTAMRSINGKKEVFYTAIEKYPLPCEIINSLNYHLFTGEDGQKLFSLIHNAPWNKMTNICRNFSICKMKGDLIADHIEGSFNLIYFDAFGPDKQPEMWSLKIFEKLSDITAENGMLLTYSVKGDVKRTIKTCGFNIQLLPRPPGKRYILKAVKK